MNRLTVRIVLAVVAIVCAACVLVGVDWNHEALLAVGLLAVAVGLVAP